jgi:hypothetical protein
MHPMPRQTPRASSTARLLGLVTLGLVTLGGLTLAVGGDAWAQATAPAPTAPPALEAGDTAPPAGALPAPAVQPLEPLDPTSPLVAPAVVSPPLAAPEPPPPPPPLREPLYRKDWFWGAVGVLVLTTAIVISLSLANADPATPNTKLGDMRAF